MPRRNHKPSRKKHGKRRRPRRSGRGRRTRRKAGLSPMKQYCKIVESVEWPDMKSDVPYQATFSLSDFFRATTIAKNFQFYKAAKVKWEYMPLYNTFQQSNNTAVVAKPQMYFIMNRDQDPYWESRAPVDAKFSMISCGVDPRAFTSNKEIIYRPNWCSPGISALTFAVVQGTSAPVSAVTNVIHLGLKKQYGWLPTPNKDLYDKPGVYNPTTAPYSTGGSLNTAPTANAGVVYNGHNIYIEQDNEPDVPVCKVMLTVEWLFKGPKNNYNLDTPTKVDNPVVTNP